MSKNVPSRPKWMEYADKITLDPELAAENARLLREHEAKEPERALRAAVDTMALILLSLQLDDINGRYVVYEETLREKGLPSPEKAVGRLSDALDAVDRNLLAVMG